MPAQQNYYPHSFVKAACCQIRGCDISPETWGKWKKLLGVPLRGRRVTKDHAQRLMTMAYLKSKNPYGRYKLPDILEVLSSNLAEGDVAAAAGRAVLKLEMNRAIGMTKGEFVPDVIAANTGRRVTYSTLYFWGGRYPSLKFSKTRVYTKSEIDRWLEIARQHAPKQAA